MADTDQRTMDLINKVKQQRAEIAKIEKPSWVTDCTFSFNENKMSDIVNLHVEKDPKVLIKIAAFIQTANVAYRAAATSLGVAVVPEFTWCGYSAADWIKDIKLRIDQIQIQAKKKKLDTLEQRLNEVMSPELRAQLALDDIANELA